MGDVDLTASARRDVEGIEEWIGQASPSRAVRFVEEPARSLDRLADMPMMGRARPEIRAGLRSIVHRPYVVFYRPTHLGITVLRGIHGARDIADMVI